VQAGTSTLVTIYTDVDGLTEADNPISANTSGFYSFYVEAGTYDLIISAPGYSKHRQKNIVITSDAAAALSALYAPKANPIFSGIVSMPTLSVTTINAAITTVTGSFQAVNSTLTGTTTITGVTTIQNATITGTVSTPTVSAITVTQAP